MTASALIEECKKMLDSYSGKWMEKKGLWEFSTLIAERKAFLSKKKLTYALKIRIDDAGKVVKFSEMLTEASSGLSSGGDMDSGFGFKTETYNTFGGTPKGTIEEQSTLFGKDYSFTFNYSEIRQKVQAVIESAGYQFEYQILAVK